MNDIKKRIDEMLEELKQERDELRVKMNLAKMEARDEWREIEAKLVKLEAKASEVREATAEAAKDIAAAAKPLADEIQDTFRRLAKRI